MPRVPVSAAGRELYALWGRERPTYQEWRDLQHRLDRFFADEPAHGTADAYPLAHLDEPHGLRFQGVLP